MAEDNEVARDLIETLRQEIDEIDEQIIELVRLRTEAASRVARLKRRNGVPMIDGNRERDVFGRYAKMLGQLGKTMASALLMKSRESDFGQKPDNDKT